MRHDSSPLIHGQYAQQLMPVRITKSASSLDVFRKEILFPRLCSPCKSLTYPLNSSPDPLANQGIPGFLHAY